LRRWRWRNCRRPAETPAAATLEAELERVAALGLHDPHSLWLTITQKNAPRGFSRDLLARMIAYRIQEQQLGKPGREMRHRLDRLAKGDGEPVRHLKVGTVLVREHKRMLRSGYHRYVVERTALLRPARRKERHAGCGCRTSGREGSAASLDTRLRPFDRRDEQGGAC